MLFTDGLIVTPDDLQAFDSEVLDIDQAQQIDINKVIIESQREVGEEIMRMAQHFYGRSQPYWLANDFAVMSRFNESGQRPRFALGQIVVTDGEYPQMWTEVKRYAVATTLFNLFRNAARRSGQDRYAESRDYWRSEIDLKYRYRLQDSGIPIVDYPLPRPGSFWLPNVGVWSNANIVRAGSTTEDPARTWVIAITYVANANLVNNESAPAEPLTFVAGSGESAVILLGKLKAPDGSYSFASLAKVAVPTLKATGWNVYAGPSVDAMTRQNDTLIPLTTTSYALAVDAITDTGEPMSQGQSALLSIKTYETFDRA